MLIAGKQYEPMNLRARTFRADAAQTRLISELGLDRVEIAPLESEPLQDYVSRLQAHISKTERIPELIGHYVMPLGKTETDWTTAMAAETAAHIEMADDEESRRLIWDLAAEFVFFFLRSNLTRLAIFPNFTDPDPMPEDDTAATEESSSPNWATGRRLSDRFRRATILPRWLLPGGRSAKD